MISIVDKEHIDQSLALASAIAELPRNSLISTAIRLLPRLAPIKRPAIPLRKSNLAAKSIKRNRSPYDMT